MPIVPPFPTIKPVPPSKSRLGGSDNGPASSDAATIGVPADAGKGWHDLNMAVARSLPTSLLRAGQFQRAALIALRGRGRMRH